MTNLLNVLKEMEQNTNGIKNDVIRFIIENSDNSEDAQNTLNDITNYGCQSGLVNHLIYYKDTVKYYDTHEKEITQIIQDYYNIDLDNLGIDQIDELADLLDTESFYDRLESTENYEKAIQTIADNEGLTIDEIEDNEEYEEYILDERYYLATELNIQDKNKLTWLAFELVTNELYSELDNIGLIENF